MLCNFAWKELVGVIKKTKESQQGGREPRFAPHQLSLPRPFPYFPFSVWNVTHPAATADACFIYSFTLVLPPPSPPLLFMSVWAPPTPLRAIIPPLLLSSLHPHPPSSSSLPAAGLLWCAAGQCSHHTPATGEMSKVRRARAARIDRDLISSCPTCAQSWSPFQRHGGDLALESN